MTAEDGEATFAFNSPCSKIHGLESIRGSILFLWRPVSPLLDANRSFGFCLECAQRQGCPWHRRTGEGQTGFDFEWRANIIQKMTFELCPHAPGTWKCDSFYNQGERAGERLKVTASSCSLGNSEPWHYCSPLPPWPVDQPPGTSSPTGVRHQLWLSLAILIMGRNTLVEQGSRLKKTHEEEQQSLAAGVPAQGHWSGLSPWAPPWQLPWLDSDGSTLQPYSTEHNDSTEITPDLICPEGLLLLEEPVLGLFQMIPLVGVASRYTHLQSSLVERKFLKRCKSDH